MAMPKAEIIPSFDLSKLTENPDNPRTLSREGEKKLAATLGEFGMVETIVANRRADGTLLVLGGHQRLKVLRKAGETHAPVSIVEVDDVGEKKLTIILNGHHGAWDGAKLSAMLEELGEQEVDLAGLGLDGVPTFEALMVELKAEEQAAAGPGGGDAAETHEVNPDDFKLKHRCPSCGFEFDKDTGASGRRSETADKRRGQGAAPAPATKKGAARKVEDDEE